MTTTYFIHERKGVKYLLRVVQKMYRWRDTHKMTAIGKTDLIHTQMTSKFHWKTCLIITDASIKKFPKTEPKEKWEGEMKRTGTTCAHGPHG